MKPNQTENIEMNHKYLMTKFALNYLNRYPTPEEYNHYIYGLYTEYTKQTNLSCFPDSITPEWWTARIASRNTAVQFLNLAYSMLTTEQYEEFRKLAQEIAPD